MVHFTSRYKFIPYDCSLSISSSLCKKQTILLILLFFLNILRALEKKYKIFRNNECKVCFIGTFVVRGGYDGGPQLIRRLANTFVSVWNSNNFLFIMILAKVVLFYFRFKKLQIMVRFCQASEWKTFKGEVLILKYNALVANGFACGRFHIYSWYKISWERSHVPHFFVMRNTPALAKHWLYAQLLESAVHEFGPLFLY